MKNFNHMFKLSVFCIIATVAQAAPLLIDLGAPGDSATINGARVSTDDPANQYPAGTGIFDTFLATKAGNGDNNVSVGYNTSAPHSGVMPNVDHAKTEDITLGQLGSVRSADGSYWFFADINEPNNQFTRYLSIDTFQVYSSPTAIDPATTKALLTGASTLRFDIDAGPQGDVSLLFNDVNSGSGRGDVMFGVPQGAFAGAAISDFIYLYVEIGKAGVINGLDYGENGGFEEWKRFDSTGVFDPVPETSTWSAVVGLAVVLMVVIAFRKR